MSRLSKFYTYNDHLVEVIIDDCKTSTASKIRIHSKDSFLKKAYTSFVGYFLEDKGELPTVAPNKEVEVEVKSKSSYITEAILNTVGICPNLVIEYDGTVSTIYWDVEAQKYITSCE
jgi:hypothetical protein